MKRVVVFLGIIVPAIVLGQENDFPIDHPAYGLISKTESLSGQHKYSAYKPFSRRTSIDYTSVLNLSEARSLELEMREYLDDSLAYQRAKPMLKKLYQFEGDFFSYKSEDFDLHINPFWQLDFGGESDYDRTLFTHSRGLRIRGTIDQKISFYTSLAENQIEYPTYIKDVADSVGLIPYEGFWKEYSNSYTTDFFRAFGYIDFGITKHVSAQIGFGRHFIGHGERSLLLSDFGNSYPYVRIETDIWKFKLTSMYSQLIADVFTFDGGTLGSRKYPKKVMINHYLDLAITPQLNLGLFEALISGEPDSLGGTQLKLEHLNPVVFYRAVEQQDGSADNVILGLDLKWTPINGISLYSQFVLDELIISELTGGDNWWGNKYGYQFGGRFYELLPGFDFTLEYNASRPFTYAHEDDFTSYTHYSQPLAHPMGANFSEFLFVGNYSPFERLSFEMSAVSASYGVNDPSSDFFVGKDPNQSYNNRDGDFGHTWRQGISGDLLLFQLISSYKIRHNLFIDVLATRRSENFERLVPSREATIIQAGFRWNTFRRRYLF